MDINIYTMHMHKNDYITIFEIKTEKKVKLLHNFK